MTCPHCSASLKPDARFCAECGATVAQSAPNNDKTIAVTPLQLPPHMQTNQPPANVYGQQSQPQPYANPYQPAAPPPPYANQYGSPNQPQPYANPYQPATPPQYAGYAPQGYNVPAVAPIPAANGRIPALLMLISSLAMVVSIFLPFLINNSVMYSLYELVNELIAQGTTDAPGEVWIFVVIPIVIVLSLVVSVLALWRRRNLWGALGLVFGLVTFGFMGLLLIGASVDTSDDVEVGTGILVAMVAGLVLLVASIVFMARKKAPR